MAQHKHFCNKQNLFPNTYSWHGGANGASKSIHMMPRTSFFMQLGILLILVLSGSVGGNEPASDPPVNHSRTRQRKSVPKAVESLVVNIFQRFNINGDKVLSWKEAQELAESHIYEDLAGMPAAEFFARADSDGSRTLSKKEITNFYLKWRRAQSAKANSASGKSEASKIEKTDEEVFIDSMHDELHPCFQSSIKPEEQAECLIRYFESRAEFESSMRDHDAQVSWNFVVEKVETSLKYYLYCMTIPLFGRAWWYNKHGRRHALFNQVINMPGRLIAATLLANFWLDATIAVKILISLFSRCCFACNNIKLCPS